MKHGLKHRSSCAGLAMLREGLQDLTNHLKSSPVLKTIGGEALSLCAACGGSGSMKCKGCRGVSCKPALLGPRPLKYVLR